MEKWEGNEEYAEGATRRDSSSFIKDIQII